MTDLKRALRLAGMLMQEGIEENADEQLTAETHRQTCEPFARATVRKSKVGAMWSAKAEQIDVDVTSVAIGPMDVTGRKTTRMLLSEENIEHLFEAAGQDALSRRRP